MPPRLLPGHGRSALVHPCSIRSNALFRRFVAFSRAGTVLFVPETYQILCLFGVLNNPGDFRPSGPPRPPLPAHSLVDGSTSFRVIKTMAQGRCPEEAVEGRR